MSIETKALALFEEANPVPDIEQLATLDIEAAAYLATFADRSSNMTQLDTKPTEEVEKRGPVLVWLAAAIAVVVLGVVLVFMNSGGDDPVATTVPATVTTVPTSTPTTASATPPTTAVSGTADLEGTWSGGPVTLDLTEGRYTLQMSGTPFDEGTFVSESGQLVLTSDGGVCPVGAVGRMSFELELENSLTVASIEDECAQRGNAIGNRALAWDETVAANDPAVLGTWASGDLEIEFTEQEYVMSRGGNLFDRGTYETALPVGSLRFQSDADSASCSEGDERSSTYAIDGDALILQASGDGCLARLDAMTEVMEFARS